MRQFMASSSVSINKEVTFKASIYPHSPLVTQAPNAACTHAAKVASLVLLKYISIEPPWTQEPLLSLVSFTLLPSSLLYRAHIDLCSYKEHDIPQLWASLQVCLSEVTTAIQGQPLSRIFGKLPWPIFTPRGNHVQAENSDLGQSNRFSIPHQLQILSI